jgi:hypothetical protein
MRRAAALAALLLAGSAGAEERFDHQGALFAIAAPGVGLSLASSTSSVNGVRWVALAGGGAALGNEQLEAVVLGRVTGRNGALEVAGLAGLRTTFGDERWKTFADFQLAVPIVPQLMAGPRFGIGVQYEVSPVAGAFCGAAVQVGLGAGLVFAADLACGLQLRTYVL